MKKKLTIKKFKDNLIENFEDTLATERPITLYLNGDEIVTLLCTPQNLQELAVGFFVAEGLLAKDANISFQLDNEKGLVWVEADKTSKLGKLNFGKRMITTGCGKGTSLYHFHGKLEPIETSIKVDIDILFKGLKEMHGQSELYLSTGGVHSAALMNTDGIIEVFREDVGRHNAADKILGYCIMNNIMIENKIFLTSGRISSEIISKISQMKIPILVSRAAPTSLAISIADELGITVIGFMRGKRANIYTHSERILT